MTIDALITEYGRRYAAHDAEGVTQLCHAPFLAVRGGVTIHLGDREAIREHFSAMMDAYRAAGAATWSPVEIDAHELGEQAAFVTVRWNARDADGELLRDTRTTYHVLDEPAGWRLLSYTNHF